MRLKVGLLVLALGACNAESEPADQAASGAQPPSGVPAAATAGPASSPMLAIPDDPAALKRLAAMGYTVHEEEGHLHAPGVNSCPKMGDGPVM